MIKKLNNPKFLGVVEFLCLFVLVFVFTKTQNLNNLKTKENTKLDSEFIDYYYLPTHYPHTKSY